MRTVSFLQLQRAATRLQKHLEHFQNLNNPPCYGTERFEDPFPETHFLVSRRKVAEFYKASISTVKKWEKQGRLSPIRHDRVLFYSTWELTNSMTKDPVISAFVYQKMKEEGMTHPKKEKKSQVIRYSATLIPGKDHMFVSVRYKGKKICFYCASSLLKDKKALEAFLFEMIFYHQYCQNLKSTSYENN